MTTRPLTTVNVTNKTRMWVMSAWSRYRVAKATADKTCSKFQMRVQCSGHDSRTEYDTIRYEMLY